MLGFIKSENYVTKEERKFDNFFKAVQEKLGSVLEDDGFAWALFKDGCTIDEAVSEIQD